ncbi:hypothetical protein BT69DRAFT_1294913 [Atractiella rhizophila]|nr:hypothetical protein BT69DRAFT_1294913 [Atractiella rhizophila]
MLKERWMNAAVESKKGTGVITAEKLVVLKSKVVAEEQEKVRKEVEKAEKLEEKVRQRMGKIEASAAKYAATAEKRLRIYLERLQEQNQPREGRRGEGGGGEEGGEEKRSYPAVEQEFRTNEMESKYCANGSWRLRRSIDPNSINNMMSEGEPIIIPVQKQDTESNCGQSDESQCDVA